MTQKIDEVEIEYRLEQLLPTAGSSTIDRLVELFRYQLSLHLIDARKDLVAVHEINKRNHTNLAWLCLMLCVFIVGMALYIIHLKGGY